MAAAVVLIAVTAGLPWLFIVVAGSPIPDRLPAWDETIAALSRRDDGFLLLGVVKYLAWLVWLMWTGPLLLEAGAHLAGRTTPHLPGLGGPQRLAALLITSLGAAVLGTTASISRMTPLPAATPGPTSAAPPAPHTAPAFRDLAAEEPEPHLPGTAFPATGALVPGGPQTVPATLRTPPRPPRRSVVRFAFRSPQLTPDARAFLTRVARDIRAECDPAHPILIVGHTDALGPAAYNQHLSVQRARAVREALGQALGHAYRYEVSGEGETAPVAPETRTDGADDPDGRARNRRVEITYALKPSTRPRTTPSPTASHQQGDGDATNTPPPSSRPAGTPSPPSAPAPTATTPPRSPLPSSPHEPPATTSPTQAPTTVDLPSGAMVGLSFAAGVGTALMASRLQRRRRHRTPRSGPDLSTSEPPPAPAVRTLRRADLAARDDGHPDPAQDHARDPLHLFPVTSSGMIVAGVRDDEEITVPIGGLVIGLTGAGADAAARAFLLALLTHAGDHDVEVIIARSDAVRLFQLSRDDVEEAAQQIRALRITPDVDAAIRLLESERIHRARLLDTADGNDLSALRTADPTEPLPRIVLAASPGAEHYRRLEALGSAAEEYDMATLVLGESAAGPTLAVDETGHVTAATNDVDAQRWERLRLINLTVEDTHQVLDVIRSAHGAPEAPPAEPPSDGPSDEPATPPPPLHQDGPARDRPAQLRVLGPPTLSVGDTELSTGIRGKARELVTFLAVHSDGAARDAILTALWPDIDQRHAVMRFHAAVNDVRRELRRATGLTDDSFVSVIAERYRIDPELIDVDLWQFRTKLHQASRADADHVRAGLLQEAVDYYTGHLAAEQSFEWVEPEREVLRRQAVEALTHLAELHKDHDPEQSLTALERARSLDRYAEEIHQRIMKLQSHLGRPDAVRRTYRLLETALEDLGADPSQETQQLLWRLLHSRNNPL